MNFNEAFPGGNAGTGLNAFDDAPTAPAYMPLPPGIYTSRVVSGEVLQTKAGDDAYRLKFEVTDGPQCGKTVMRMFTFGPKAMPYTKRDLAPFGLTATSHLLSPFPPGGKEYRVRLVVAIQRGDDGIVRNDIKKIEVLEVKDTPAASYPLPPEPSEGGAA